MPDNTTSLFANVNAIATVMERRCGGNDAIGGYNLNMTVSNFPISVRPTGQTDTFDYFLVEVQGKAHLISQGDWQPNAYGIYVGLPQGAEMVDSSPDTTSSTTSYTASVSTTVGGSFGFFGGDLTGSVSASETIGHSTTQNTADLRIMNLQDDNAMIYLIARDSLLTQAEAPLLAQFLIKRPHSDATLDLSFTWRAYFQGGDRGALGGGWSGVDQCFSGFENPAHPEREPDYAKDSAAVDYVSKVNLTAPPAPRV